MTNRQAGSMFPTLPNRTDCFCGSGSRTGIHITLYKLPSPVICHSLHTLKMTGTHQEELIDHLRVVFVFIEFNFLLYLIFSRHRTQQNPAPAQPASPSPPPPAPRRRRKPQNPWILPWILQREERGCYRTLLDELITTDIPGYRNFTRMEPAFFYLIEERITPPPQEVNHQLQEATGSWLETGSYFERLIHRGKLHLTAIPLEGWKIDHLQVYPPDLQKPF